MQKWEKGVLNEVDRRSPRVVRPAFEDDAGLSCRGEQCRKHRLKHKRNRPAIDLFRVRMIG